MRVIIVGNCGSGKTWVANKLAQIAESRVIHLDDIYWEPGSFDKERSPEAIDTMIEASKFSDSWIVEGVFGELAERFIERAETLIWLDIDWATCRERLLKRDSESTKHMNRTQSAEGLDDLIEWASLYDKRHDAQSHEGHKRLMNNFHGEKLHLTLEAEVVNMIEKARQGYFKQHEEQFLTAKSAKDTNLNCSHEGHKGTQETQRKSGGQASPRAIKK